MAQLTAELTPELATLKARANAQSAAQLDLAERLKNSESQLAEGRAAASAVREDAAHLRGQAGTLSQQNAELLLALKARDGRGKPPP